MKPTRLKVFTAFSGYDSQCLALDRLSRDYPDFSYELVGWSEIDKYAISAHNALYPEAAHLNFGDISKIDWGGQIPDFDLFTYSFPCQDISSAGHQRGFAEGSGSRSSLLWECRRAIEAKHPRFLLMENVKALIQKKHLPDFHKWISWLEEQGYKNFWQVLNAKDYGVPQNRERVFMVSILDPKARFEFPKPFPLERRLKDVLEPSVDICQANEQGYIECPPGGVFDASYPNSPTRRGRVQDGGEVTPTICSAQQGLCLYEGTEESTERIIQVGNIVPDHPKFKNRIQGRIYAPEGLSPTLNTHAGGGLEPKIAMPLYRIRKLTPRECFRLMAVDDESIDLIQSAGISNSQQYKLAGNSIVVSCLYHIFHKMFVDPQPHNPTTPQQLTLFPQDYHAD